MPLLSNLSGPIQHFRAAIIGAWRNKVSADLCARKGFRGGPWLDIDGTLQLLDSDHVRERDKALLREYPCWWCLEWASSWVRFRVRMCLVGSVGVVVMTVISFGTVLFHL